MQEKHIIKKLQADVKRKGLVKTAVAIKTSYGNVWNAIHNGEFKTKRVMKVFEAYYSSQGRFAKKK